MELVATKRSELGKKSKKLKLKGLIPGVVYGKGLESSPVTVSYKDLEKTYDASGESTLIDFKIGEEKPFKVLISEVEIHPVTGKMIHANFHKVNLKEKINATVPIKIVGESPAVKSGLGLLLTLIDELHIEVLPSDLPHHIEVNISNLNEVEQGVQIKDLNIDREKIKIIGNEEDDLVVKIDYAEMKEEVAPVEAPTEAELIAKVEATKELTEEEKALRDKAKKDEKDKASK